MILTIDVEDKADVRLICDALGDKADLHRKLADRWIVRWGAKYDEVEVSLLRKAQMLDRVGKSLAAQLKASVNDG